jgi:hypothetical protein
MVADTPDPQEFFYQSSVKRRGRMLQGIMAGSQ